MKYPSSPIVVYSMVYASLVFVAIILHVLLLPVISSPLYRFYLIDFSITCILFYIGNYLFLWNNIYDLHWPLIPLLSSIYFHLTLDSIEIFFSLKHLLLIVLIGLWAFHLVWQTISSSTDIHHEDWRYQMMRKDYQKLFPIFAFFALHLLPMFEVLLGSSSIYHICIHTYRHQTLTKIDLFFFGMIFSGVLLENLADKQLNDFRRYKHKSKQSRFAVLASGLWKYSRHPNYLGEMIFWWGLFFLGRTYHAPLWCGLGPLLITIMMIFGSIPMSEERLYRKYPEYKFVQQDIPMLIPTFGLFV